LAQHEREVRETRLVVLRDALQVHYQDLIKFADRMDALVARGDPLMTLQAERLYSALRQHLPRSPLWKSIEDWNKNCDDMEQARSGLRMELTAVMSQDTNLKQAFDGGQQDAEGVVDFFLKQSEFWSRAWPGLEIGEAFKTSEVENNRVKLKLGAYSIGMSPNNKITEIKKALVSLRKNLPDRSSFQRLTSGCEFPCAKSTGRLSNFYSSNSLSCLISSALPCPSIYFSITFLSPLPLTVAK